MKKPIYAKTLIATPETDAKLRKQYNADGRAAFERGAPRVPDTVQDPTSMVGAWWFEGYDKAERDANG